MSRRRVVRTVAVHALAVVAVVGGVFAVGWILRVWIKAAADLAVGAVKNIPAELRWPVSITALAAQICIFLVGRGIVARAGRAQTGWRATALQYVVFCAVLVVTITILAAGIYSLNPKIPTLPFLAMLIVQVLAAASAAWRSSKGVL